MSVAFAPVLVMVASTPVPQRPTQSLRLAPVSGTTGSVKTTSMGLSVSTFESPGAGEIEGEPETTSCGAVVSTVKGQGMLGGLEPNPFACVTWKV